MGLKSKNGYNDKFLMWGIQKYIENIFENIIEEKFWLLNVSKYTFWKKYRVIENV